MRQKRDILAQIDSPRVLRAIEINAAKVIDGWLVEYLMKNRGCGPTEFDREVNDLTRAAMYLFLKRHSVAWVGNVNRYSDRAGKPILGRFCGQKVFNFEHSFIVPHYDHELCCLIFDHNHAGFSSLAQLVPSVASIHCRILELGGDFLTWV